MDSTTAHINIIGGGRLGRSLAKLWHSHNAARIAAVCNRSLQSATEATTFIGAGQPCSALEQLKPAPLWLIATADSDIENTAQQLAETGTLRRGDIVFHCSGSLSSKCLGTFEATGAYTASVHPIHSFADPDKTQTSFAGTYCAIEGSQEALDQLQPLFQTIGAITFSLRSSEHKALYHSATVMACNYLVTLQDCALHLLQQAGIERNQGLELLAPIVRQTADNVTRQDTTTALTGPIARGDSSTIAQHLQAIQQQAPDLLILYSQLGLHTLPIAAQQGSANSDQLRNIEKQLKAATDNEKP
ncbi:DUF2520 domain-containing protein [Porticoccus sp. W117]|uniref:Rossmann-like and DUF2520 domain-containing protein n=1 Tax=Porticoccus sp. W117 TaxID=3054777 RepID=UPI002596D26B|nr:Rossmann-like and DUF2520 domain-containing protein [Porticoccus sp. W117]MDM3872113.1 DUF2520 domain-containing protein [Porticoccus sp. W117]